VRKKYIFITGGVVSSLGKGLMSASIGRLLESQGLSIAMMKFDPYFNVDPGTMNPFQHGEVYVTEDGVETDLDLGHYYRYTSSPLSRLSNATSGQIYHSVIEKERSGDYLGDTVQVIPHVVNEIKSRIVACAEQQEGIEVTLVEIGGTVGDIESQPFLEAIRQFRLEFPQDCVNVHLTYIPYISAAGELKTKPTQHSVQVLRGIGIIPDFILCRSERSLTEEQKEKIALFCSVPKEAVLELLDVKSTVYELPLNLLDQHLDRHLCTRLQMECYPSDMSAWEKMVYLASHPTRTIVVGLVGKYVRHQDAYKSIIEALHHSAAIHQVEVLIKGFSADDLDCYEGCDGYVIPGGFGERGFNGKMEVVSHCRKEKIPCFGICLGMQVFVVEFARSVLGLEKAHSTEIDFDTPHPIISLLNDQKGVISLGGTMRLGAYPCRILPHTRAAAAYRVEQVSERHRHRYELNSCYLEQLQEGGMIVSGVYEKEHLCEIVEVVDHPWMVGVQFHPEYQSKPICPHPLFNSFSEATLRRRYKDG